MNKGGVWINKKFKNYYLDSSKNGLRLSFFDDISLDDKKIIRKYVNYLRKKYFFPIRCNIYFENQKLFPSLDETYKCRGLFLYGDEQNLLFPEIYVPTKINKALSKEDCIYYFTKLLTYYFQWYFNEEDSRTNRSLEIEATKYAEYLVNRFLSNKKRV